MDPTYGRAKAGRPARTYIQQLCEDTGCSPEGLPEVMNDREKWISMLVAQHDDVIYLFVCIYLPLCMSRILTVRFKRNLTSLNSEFSFSLTSCYTKVENPSLLYYLPFTGERERERENWIHSFLKGISTIWNANRIWIRCCTMSISYITPGMAPFIYIYIEREREREMKKYKILFTVFPRSLYVYSQHKNIKIYIWCIWSC